VSVTGGASGLAVRAIDATELAWWGALGGADHADQARSLQAEGRSGPDRWLVAERAGSPVGRVGIAWEDAGCGRGRLEHRLFAVWIDPADSDVAAIGGALGRAALVRLPLGIGNLILSSNTARDRVIEARRSILRPIGGRLFQEKVGVVWEDDGGPLSPSRYAVRDVRSVGRDAFAALMGRCQSDTLDRNDRYYIGLCGPARWGTEMLGYLTGEDESSWLAIEDADGRPMGFVAVGAFPEPGVATIVHIGVVPEARGRHLVDELLRVAAIVARERGFAQVLSDVDVENGPMLAALERAHHRADQRPWHVWADRVDVVVTADGTPVTLRDLDISDREALMALQRGPGQERYLGSMASHFEDAIEDARAEPRMWALHAGEEVVGFVMISDGIPAERLAAEEDLVGPYFLWRLLVDAGRQGRGYGRAAIDLVREYLGSRPGADVLLTSCKAGEGSPQPFYLGYGFTLTGEVKWGEDLLRLDLHEPAR
jgi:diamine N-acetyltransferase